LPQLPKLGIPFLILSDDFIWEKDLQWLGGPLLSLFRGPEGCPYLLHWVDCDPTHNRWLAVQISRSEVKELLARKKTLYDALIEGKNFFLLDSSRSGTFASCYFVVAEQIPQHYFPEKGVFLDFDLIPELSTHD